MTKSRPQTATKPTPQKQELVVEPEIEDGDFVEDEFDENAANNEKKR